jgi:hypothetical protein
MRLLAAAPAPPASAGGPAGPCTARPKPAVTSGRLRFRVTTVGPSPPPPLQALGASILPLLL